MSMANKDIKTIGYVMRRTNYGEADRILDIITPQGKIAAIARSARREKSKLPVRKWAIRCAVCFNGV